MKGTYNPKYRGKGRHWARGIKDKQWGYAGRIPVVEEFELTKPCKVRYICVVCTKAEQWRNKRCEGCQ